MDRRGALLGPEGSGLAHRDCCFWGLVLFLLGHCSTDCGWVWWLGPAVTKLLVVCLMGVLFPWMVGLSGVWWGLGRCSCPYFENCIVDASISL